MDTILLQLLEELEDIGDSDESLFNSAARQAIRNAVMDAFVRQQSGFVLPESFELSTPQANAEVKYAIEMFVTAALPVSLEQGLGTFHQRLAAIQNGTVLTDEDNDYEEFLGHSPPELFDQDGNVIRLV